MTYGSIIRPVGAVPGDLGWIVQRHAEYYAAEHGWDITFEQEVTRIVADFASRDSPSQAGWIAELNGERAGCVLVVPSDQPNVARLRLLLVDPGARGRGLGERLVRFCVAFARDAGYEAIKLYTVSILTAARHVYKKAGFALTSSSEGESFGTTLVDEYWNLALR